MDQIHHVLCHHSHILCVSQWYTLWAFSRRERTWEGDPLSLYLFILCAKILSWNIQKLASQTFYHGIKIPPRNPEITHLMYANFMLIFGRANFKEAYRLQRLLETYCLASEQDINYKKSQLIHHKSLHPKFQKLLH